MTEFENLVTNKLALNFDKKNLKDAEILIKKIFSEDSAGGSIAIEEFLLDKIKSIIESSEIDLKELQKIMGESEGD